MKRRKFIRLMAIIPTALVASSWNHHTTASFESVIDDPLHEVLKKIIRKKLDYLQISAEDINNFVADFVRIRKLRKRLGSMELPFRIIYVASDFVPIHRISDKLKRLEESIITDFMMSSDYFYHQPRLNKARYIGFYLPHLRPCANPFAIFVDA